MLTSEIIMTRYYMQLVQITCFVFFPSCTSLYWKYLFAVTVTKGYLRQIRNRFKQWKIPLFWRYWTSAEYSDFQAEFWCIYCAVFYPSINMQKACRFFPLVSPSLLNNLFDIRSEKHVSLQHSRSLNREIWIKNINYAVQKQNKVLIGQ